MRRLTPTQTVTLRTLADTSIPEDGFSFSMIRSEIPGVNVRRSTLEALYSLGLVDCPCKDHSGWRITKDGIASLTVER